MRKFLKSGQSSFRFALSMLVQSLPKGIEGRALGAQIVRSGTSVAASYRAACRARSKTEFIAKIGVVLEEADETVLWLGIDRRIRPAAQSPR